jgi:hypothetical protein
MALQSKFDFDSEELALGLCFFDSILLAYTFWDSDLTVKGAEFPRLSIEQLLMYTDQSQRILYCTGRKIGKSLVEESQILRKAISSDITPGQTIEGLITTPGSNQMELVHKRFIQKIIYDPLLSTLIATRTSGENPTVRFRNGFIWHFRLEGMSGDDRNMIGIRAQHIIGDEQQLSNWACFDSRKMTSLPDCTFMYAGVPDGRRGSPFYALDQTSLGKVWSRHKYSSFVNPINQTEEGKRKIAEDFGSEGSFSYQTLVLGKWGSETISSFPPGTIAFRPTNKVIIKEFRGEQVEPYVDNLGIVLQVPARHCHSWACGIDFGSTSDPTVMLFFVRTQGDGDWMEWLKITLNGVNHLVQASVFKYLADNCLIGKFIGASTDSQQLLESLQHELPDRSSTLWNAQPAGTTVLLEADGRIKTDPQGKPLKMRNKQFIHELLRKYMLNALMSLEGTKIWVGDDNSLVEELASTTERKTEAGFVQYYSPKGTSLHVNKVTEQGDHQRDALTFLVYALYLGLMQDNSQFSEAELLGSLGWVGDAQGWQAPY